MAMCWHLILFLPRFLIQFFFSVSSRPEYKDTKISAECKEMPNYFLYPAWERLNLYGNNIKHYG